MYDTGDPVLIDERLFSTFALLNALGFNDEFREEGMHPVRTAVREELARRDPSIFKPARAYQRQHPDASWFAYTQYSLMLSAPPFSLMSGYEDTWAASVLPGFDHVLRSFYCEALLSELWCQYLPEYEKDADLIRPEVFGCVGDMWTYLRVSREEQHSKIRVVPNLMNSYFRATVFQDPLTGIVHVVSGPYSEQAQITLTVVHELLHTVLGSPLDQLASEVKYSSSLLNLVADLPTVVRNGGQYDTVVEESLVRALTKRIGSQLYGEEGYVPHAAQEYREGWVLIWHFLEHLESAYEKGHQPLVTMLPEMIAAIDVCAETDRWMRT